MITVILNVSVGICYVILGIFLIRLVSEIISAAAKGLGIGDSVWFERMFRLFALMFFLGCAYSHGEIAIHAYEGSLPPEFYESTHRIPMVIQNIGSWGFVLMLWALERQTVRRA